MCRIYNKKDTICNEDEDHSKDASSISLPEDDRREPMENFNGAGQDYEDLSNNNVPPLANNGHLLIQECMARVIKIYPTIMYRLLQIIWPTSLISFKQWMPIIELKI